MSISISHVRNGVSGSLQKKSSQKNDKQIGWNIHFMILVTVHFAFKAKTKKKELEVQGQVQTNKRTVAVNSIVLY
jgi:hypothetical protein